MRKWLVKVRVPGPGGEKTSSETFLIEADNPSDACGFVSEHLDDTDFVGESADIINVRESTIQSLIPFSAKKKK